MLCAILFKKDLIMIDFTASKQSSYFIGSGDALNVKESKTYKRQKWNTNKNSSLLTV